jgi:RNA polymerase sigma factor (sigma-70 family)
MTERRFATTRWSIVLAAGSGPSTASRAALETLCDSYWYPLYAYARCCGRREEDARDLVQGFFAHLLEKDLVGVADPDRGRFRTFLRTAFRNFMTNEWRRDTAAKRGGGRVLASLDTSDPEERYRREPAGGTTPERAFERAWALEVLERALARLRATYEAKGNLDLFEALKGHLDGSAETVPHAESARRLGTTEGAVKVAVHRLRQRCRQALRDEIAQTLDEGEILEEEIRELLEALG